MEDADSVGGRIYERAIMFDSGPLISLYDPRDDRGSRVQEIIESASSSKYPLCISLVVISETHKRLLYDTGYHSALRFVGDFDTDIRQGNINLLIPTIGDIERCVDILRRFSDQDISFTDALTMTLMKREGIRKVLTFDRHFQLLNFSLIQ